MSKLTKSFVENDGRGFPVGGGPPGFPCRILFLRPPVHYGRKLRNFTADKRENASSHSFDFRSPAPPRVIGPVLKARSLKNSLLSRSGRGGGRPSERSDAVDNYYGANMPPINLNFKTKTQTDRIFLLHPGLLSFINTKSNL